MFDREILFSEYQKISFPNWFFFKTQKDDPTLHKSWLMSFLSASKADVEKTMLLPNFDYKVFENISGISKNMIDKKIMEV